MANGFGCIHLRFGFPLAPLRRSKSFHATLTTSDATAGAPSIAVTDASINSNAHTTAGVIATAETHTQTALNSRHPSYDIHIRFNEIYD